MTTTREATIADLEKVSQKAELVNGEVVVMSPTGGLPNRAAGNIYLSLREYERRVGGGRAYTDNVAFIVDLPRRKSFSPDVAFHRGTEPSMKFVPGAPTFVVEVRSEGDYGDGSERAMAAKRADYFAAGTLVVWDVDLLGEDVVRAYASTDPARPRTYRRGQEAGAEPALPGWRLAVDALFE
jgi:Uma2 family endonuclease